MKEHGSLGLTAQASDNPMQKVLLVDDQLLNLAFACAVLEDMCIALQASCGEDALQLALSERPDLILLDVRMPNMDGFEVCRQLKLNPSTAHIAVIFLTALDDQADEELGLTLGAIDYISKPFNPVILRARVRNHLLTQRQRQQLEQHAHMDGLTGIFNRRKFDSVAEFEWQRMQALQQPLSVLLIDVDYFKPFNDHFGHLEGDQALQKIANAIKCEMQRKGDTASRYGGEEFVCILPQTDREGATQIAERIRCAVLALRIAHPKSTTGPWLSVSIGATSLIPSAKTCLETLLNEADKCLYSAKNDGRNKVVSQ